MTPSLAGPWTWSRTVSGQTHEATLRCKPQAKSQANLLKGTLLSARLCIVSGACGRHFSRSSSTKLSKLYTPRLASTSKAETMLTESSTGPPALRASPKILAATGRQPRSRSVVQQSAGAISETSRGNDSGLTGKNMCRRFWLSWVIQVLFEP